MQLRRYKDIVAFKARDNRVVAFHPSNLEIAEIDESAWSAMDVVPAVPSKSAPFSEANNSNISNINSALEELAAWSSSQSETVTDLKQNTSVRYYSVNIAQICNLACTYCAAGGDGTYGSKTTKVDTSKVEKQLQMYLSHLPENEIFEIRFLGGEPLLYPSLIEHIANYARLLVAGRKIHLIFSITTNGTLITPKVAQLLAALKAEVTISLDGDAEVNEKNRPSKSGKNSTLLTLRGIEELNKVKSQLGRLKVNSVFGTHNLEVAKTYDYLTSFNFEWDSINLNYANNDSIESSSRYISEMQKVAEMAYAKKGLYGLAQITQFRSTLARLETQSRIHSYCGAGKSLVQADTKADLYTCNWLMNDKDEKLNLEQAWPALPESLIEMNNCQTCWARHLCGGGCMAVHKAKTNSKHLKANDFCFRQRSLSAIAIEYYFLNLN